MANNIDTSQVVDPNTLQPFLAPSLAFLQAANKEMVKGIIYGLLGESLFSYVANGFGGAIVSGCTKSGSGATIFNGWVWYADELFFFPGGMGLTSFTNPPRVIIDETNDASIDPIQFSDLTMKSVHKVRRLRVVDQASGGFLLSAMGRFISDTVLIGTNTATSSAAEFAVANTSFTSPPRVCDIEINIEGVLAIGGNGATNAEGIYVYLKNVTTSANVASTQLVFNDMSVTGLASVPTRLTYIQRGVPASTNFQVYIKRFATINSQIIAPVVTYKEIQRTKLW